VNFIEQFSVVSKFQLREVANGGQWLTPAFSVFLFDLGYRSNTVAGNYSR
jgi:hypothetical protein